MCTGQCYAGIYHHLLLFNGLLQERLVKCYSSRERHTNNLQNSSVEQGDLCPVIGHQLVSRSPLKTPEFLRCMAAWIADQGRSMEIPPPPLTRSVSLLSRISPVSYQKEKTKYENKGCGQPKHSRRQEPWPKQEKPWSVGRNFGPWMETGNLYWGFIGWPAPRFYWSAWAWPDFIDLPGPADQIYWHTIYKLYFPWCSFSIVILMLLLIRISIVLEEAGVYMNQHESKPLDAKDETPGRGEIAGPVPSN